MRERAFPRAPRSHRLRIGQAVLALAAAAALLAPALARAELLVRLSRSTTGRFESVGITVVDPLGGLDAKPGALKVTMADGADQRHPIFLEPTGRPGEWAGRFTPLKAGRYTGTAVLERNDERELGLVPLLRVRPSKRPGFLRIHPNSRRAFKFSQGGTFFPLGVTLRAEDFRPAVNWRTEFARLKRNGANYVELPIDWPSGDALAQARQLRILDALVVEAELAGLVTQVRFRAPPASVAAEARRDQLQQWVRRWAYSTAVGVWVVECRAGSDLQEPARCAQAVRAVDGYGHLLALAALPERGSKPETPAGRPPTGYDLWVAPWNWERPGNQFALFDVTDYSPVPPPLPGETSWQLLALGGVGMPLWPYRPQSRESGALLLRLASLSRAIAEIPFDAPAAPQVDAAAPDAPASYCRYGAALVGWQAVPSKGPALMPVLPAGRYRVQLWNPQANAPFLPVTVTSDGRAPISLTLPAGVRSLAFVARPAAAKEAAPSRAPEPARKPSAKKPPAKTPSTKKSGGRTPAAGAEKKTSRTGTKPARTGKKPGAAAKASSSARKAVKRKKTPEKKPAEPPKKRRRR